jgi:dolichol-phosphate mannosyltransferase
MLMTTISGGKFEYMNTKTAVVIPCYCVKEQVVEVVRQALTYVDAVICVDDACPQNSGRLVEETFDDPRVLVLHNSNNKGVGGATKAGFKAALDGDFGIIIKVDGDGQMDTSLIPSFIRPLRDGLADYCKGNRFYELEYLKRMPVLRLFGNSVLSLFSKFSSGYWHLLDPSNGYLAVRANVLRRLPFDKISDGYFFESDMLFRLNIARAVVMDIPIVSQYGSEQSSLKIHRIIVPFIVGHVRNFVKRVFYTYFLRDFNIGSLHLISGIAAVFFGLIFGISAWSESVASGIPASAGTVMLAGLPFLIGIQLLLSFLNYDIQNVPVIPVSTFDENQVRK